MKAIEEEARIGKASFLFSLRALEQSGKSEEDEGKESVGNHATLLMYLLGEVDCNKTTTIISGISNITFPNLQLLHLSDNTITTIEALSTIDMPKLTSLLLGIHQIRQTKTALRA